ncbi:MAG: hypothetical protein GYA17_07420 [Chloroflexi bacterium]|jgi:hypothetical protein|nr:hypothetical protein [Anaerolineaceae bacterium]NMB88173.1 hypothetical protein [Chloroflexota bacterium]
MTTPTPEKGEIEAITFGDKVLTVKRRCSCGGDVEIKKISDEEGSVATCLRCGASLKWGATKQS